MELPKLDITTLPDLDTMTGMFGTAADKNRIQASDDSIIVIITFLATSK